MSKFFVLKKYFLIILQALSVVLVGACIIFYAHYSAYEITTDEGVVYDKIALSDIRGEYYEHEDFTKNLTGVYNRAIKYAVLKSEFETDGVYDPKKIVFIGSFANRTEDFPYKGTDVAYYLEDLVAWGQFGISTNGISHSYKVFDSWDSLYDFFGKASEDHPATSSIPMLDVVSNRYLSVQNLKLEDYASNPDEYADLVSYLEESAITLYNDYREYEELTNFFSTDYSNVKYYITTGKTEEIYTNILNYKLLDSDKLMDTFKNLGPFIFACPSGLDFVTNTKLTYDEINNSIEKYAYFYSDDSTIWFGVDSSFPVEDVFSRNYDNISMAGKIIPWIFSFATLGLVAFIVLMVVIISEGKKRLSDESVTLNFVDHLPVEIEILFCLLLLVLISLFKVFVSGVNETTAISLAQTLFPQAVCIFLFAFVSLYFFYSLARRVYRRSLLEKSIIVSIFSFFGSKLSFIKKFFWRLYDSAGVAIRTWGAFIFFMIFNTFWASMLFFSSRPVLSFVILFIFDLGTGVILFNRNCERKSIVDAIERISRGEYDLKLNTNKMHGDNKQFAETVNSIGDSIRLAVETSSKDEKLKADLITNVSHDIKTPLTSIINYVDLIKRENLENERVKNYVRILDEKSQRLKQLTMDLVEASKITSGNISLELSKINFAELIYQTQGEFDEKFAEKELTLVTTMPKDRSIQIEADPRYIWRIVENLFQNVYKYAMPSTRVYLDVFTNYDDNTLIMELKNISSQQLNINANELTERFIRGDVARSTEGSGLGLSIVKSLVKAHNGTFDIYLDGDLFKATVKLPIVRT